MRAVRWTAPATFVVMLVAVAGFLVVNGAPAGAPEAARAANADRSLTAPASGDAPSSDVDRGVEAGEDACTSGHQGPCPHCHDDEDCTVGNPGHPACCGPAGGFCSAALRCICNQQG